MSVTIDASEVLKALNNLQNDRVAKNRMLQKITQDGKKILTQKAESISATSKLHNSIYNEVTGDTGYIKSHANYSNIALETGRKPGKPPPSSALKRWARLKLGNEKLAFVVARSIGKKGTKANKFVTQTVQELNRRIIPKYLTDYWNQISK